MDMAKEIKDLRKALMRLQANSGDGAIDNRNGTVNVSDTNTESGHESTESTLTSNASLNNENTTVLKQAIALEKVCRDVISISMYILAKHMH